jgi:hypothetical protein
MSEYLSFQKNGQWELHKATNDHTGDQMAPKDMDKPGNKPYKVYNGADLTGQLPKDIGQKGTLHDTNGGLRPKAEHPNYKNVGKPNRPMDSYYTARNPGVGD